MDKPPELAGGEEYEAELARAVMEYLSQHPRAMDTVNGIVDWWIPAGGVRVDPVSMRRVLDQLVQRGFLERIGQGNYTHYRLKTAELQSDAKHDGA